MSDTVTVPYGKDARETAVLLLAAAEELGLDTGVVKTAEGAFVVPPEVHDKAFSSEKANAPAKKAAKKK